MKLCCRTRTNIPLFFLEQDAQNSILLVTVLNVLYPVTIETLQRIFAKYGQIQKIVIFTKNGT